jgi:protoporphyrinogen oxidase
MMPKIIIMGCGIGGLTVAHELANAIDSNYEIHLYDRHDKIGGMARSGLKSGCGAMLPTEYC